MFQWTNKRNQHRKDVEDIYIYTHFGIFEKKIMQELIAIHEIQHNFLYIYDKYKKLGGKYSHSMGNQNMIFFFVRLYNMIKTFSTTFHCKTPYKLCYTSNHKSNNEQICRVQRWEKKEFNPEFRM